jgi:hypothetical protein
MVPVRFDEVFLSVWSVDPWGRGLKPRLGIGLWLLAVSHSGFKVMNIEL